MPPDYPVLFQRALGRRYVAAMFDIDGTLMETGAYEIPPDVVRTLAELATRVPLAICSGRRLEGLMELMDPVFRAAPHPEAARANWTFFLESGAMGLTFNPSTGAYEKFYQIDWPTSGPTMDEMFERVRIEIPKVFPKVTFHKNECNIGMYVPNRERFDLKELGKITSDMAQAARRLLKEFEHSDELRVVDSGVAAHILPRDGDKDRGIREFARILRDEYGLSIGPEAREILIVGDQPCAGCNDEKLLEGKWGTPFTAEHLNPGSPWPIPIFNAQGTILTGPEATVSLLKQATFVSAP